MSIRNVNDLHNIRMCHNIITKSVYCENETHGEYRKVICRNMWFKPWNKVVKCKKQRDLRDELAVECDLCRTEGPKPTIEPWNTICITLPVEETTSSREASPELWSWDDDTGLDMDGVGAEVVVDTDTDTSLQEMSKEEPEEQKT